MKVTCDICISYDSVDTAKKVHQSISVDDFEFVSSAVEGTRLVASMKSSSISSLMHTVDDYLACVSVAEKVVEKG